MDNKITANIVPSHEGIEDSIQDSLLMPHNLALPMVAIEQRLSEIPQMPGLPTKKFNENLSVIANALTIPSKIIVETMNAIGQGLRNFISTFATTAFKFAESVGQFQQQRFEFKKAILDAWSNLENDLMTNNRYFPNDELKNLFMLYANKDAGYKLRKGSLLYRARKISISELRPEVMDKIRRAGDKSYAQHDPRYYVNDEWLWDFINSTDADDMNNECINAFNGKDMNFWGFNATHSGAPPKNPIDGRVNPIGINCLYTTKDVKTAISETQPTAGQMISVARIKTRKQMRLFSFDFSEYYAKSPLMKLPLREFEEQVGVSYGELKIFFQTLSELFSTPISGNTENYYATQYLSGLIKHLGFDGIKFKSSLNTRGVNIVLFDVSKDAEGIPNQYEVVNSVLHRVKRVNVTSVQVFPRKVKSISKADVID